MAKKAKAVMEVSCVFNSRRKSRSLEPPSPSSHCALELLSAEQEVVAVESVPEAEPEKPAKKGGIGQQL